ncbi:PREDICTED: scavenger receptor class B member 1-like isoform X1 [Polistes canadensis]|uniref:scavenger receptor class B member 1-like isoform X1 n=1 Tax=Polistes canadensis TaxID=91411 RepID=UPI000718B235|nr:PREDICTED: scavenger receptor class B member 1-like isoform X1 [Polistes canadensis]
MKDILIIWNRLIERRRSTVNNNNFTTNGTNEHDELTISRNTRNRRKSSVLMNQFFNPTTTLPIQHNDRQKRLRSIFILMALGLIGLTTGCFILVCRPYDLLFQFKVIFSEGGEIFEFWRKPDVDIFLKVYLFNITNHDEFLSGKDSKLNFQEVGPYVYKEKMEHGNVKFNNNDTISVTPLHPLVYVPEMSNGTEQDILILPNIALLSITNVMRETSYFTRWGLNLLIIQTDTKPLVPMTAREFMFGYESTLVTLGNKFMPAWIKFDKLGLIDRMYDFDGDYETIYTGENNVKMTGLIDKYNGNVDLPYWKGKCANIHGASDGTKFPTYIQPNDTLLFFRKSLCRSAHMTRTGEKVVKGLYAYKYNFMENDMDNGAYNEDNKCFCREGRCLPPGLIDVTACYYGFPIALSFPHFYKSHPSLLEAVNGLQPNPKKHESYFYIQPESGLPVDLAFRFQINMAFQEIGHMARVEKFSNFVLPLLWFEIGMYELPSNRNALFYIYLNVLPVLQEVVIYLLFIFGTIFLIWSVVKILLYRPKESTINGEWFEEEMQRKRLQFLNDRSSFTKTKEAESYYNTLLNNSENKTASNI